MTTETKTETMSDEAMAWELSDAHHRIVCCETGHLNPFGMWDPRDRARAMEFLAKARALLVPAAEASAYERAAGVVNRLLAEATTEDARAELATAIERIEALRDGCGAAPKQTTGVIPASLVGKMPHLEMRVRGNCGGEAIMLAAWKDCQDAEARGRWEAFKQTASCLFKMWSACSDASGSAELYSALTWAEQQRDSCGPGVKAEAPAPSGCLACCQPDFGLDPPSVPHISGCPKAEAQPAEQRCPLCGKLDHEDGGCNVDEQAERDVHTEHCCKSHGAQPAASEGYDWAERAALLGAKVARLTRDLECTARQLAEDQQRVGDLTEQVARLTRERDEARLAQTKTKAHLETALREVLGSDEVYPVAETTVRVFREQRKQLDEQAAEIARLKEQLAIVKTPVEGIWRWQGDDLDMPESLTCPVVMSVEILRGLLAKEVPAPQAPPAEATMPRLVAAVSARALEPAGLMLGELEAAARADMADAVKAAVETCAKGFAVLQERAALELKQMREVIVGHEAAKPEDAEQKNEGGK